MDGGKNEILTLYSVFRNKFDIIQSVRGSVINWNVDVFHMEFFIQHKILLKICKKLTNTFISFL